MTEEEKKAEEDGKIKEFVEKLKKKRLDSLARMYLHDKRNFADFFNLYFDGRIYIDPDKLTDLDTRSADFAGDSTVEAYRDVFKEAVVEINGEEVTIVLGIENQSRSDEDMAVRVFFYDAIAYREQSRKKEKKYSPIKTVVLDWSREKQWNAPQSLYDLFPEEVRPIQDEFCDYGHDVFDPTKVKEEDLDSRKTNLQVVFRCVKYAAGKDKKKLLNYLKEEKRGLNRIEIILLMKILRREIDIDYEKEEYQMNDLMDAIEQDFKAEGKAEERVSIVKYVMKNTGCTAETAMNNLGIAPENREAVLKML